MALQALLCATPPPAAHPPARAGAALDARRFGVCLVDCTTGESLDNPPPPESLDNPPPLPAVSRAVTHKSNLLLVRTSPVGSHVKFPRNPPGNHLRNPRPLNAAAPLRSTSDFTRSKSLLLTARFTLGEATLPQLEVRTPPSRPPSRTNWTRLVHPSVLIGRVLSPCRPSTVIPVSPARCHATKTCVQTRSLCDT